ncbi:MAG: inositol monophosphatase [Proteobacteria bacterium]|nr:inositol monophosphatase [Pseudomonadota bacterium]
MESQPILEDLRQLAQQAGEILAAGYEKEHQLSFKGEIDLVTEIDHRSEEFLVGELRRRFPGHQVLAEESGGKDGGRHQWYLDPLDGTVNYAHGVPFFCVSIAYAVAGELTLAAVFDPMRDELFTAQRGMGAWLNGRPLTVRPETELSRSLLVTGFPYDIWKTAQNNLDHFSRFAKISQGVRRLGSAALDLCYVAAGRFDGYWELSLKPWDLAAGVLIALEAGARVTTIDGDADCMSPPYSVLAAAPVIHGKMLATLQTVS